MWWKIYLRRMLITYKTNIAYSLNFVVGFLNIPATLILYYFFWKVIFEQGASLPYSFNEMVGYLSIATVSIGICYSDASNRLEDKIKRGDISIELGLPNDLFLMDLVGSIPSFIISLAQGLPYLLLFILILNIPLQLSITHVLLFLLSLLIGKLINHLIYYMIGSIAFWTESVWGFVIGIDLLSSFMSGMMIPLEILPPHLRQVALILPFRFVAYTPTRVLQGIATPEELGLMIAWLLVLIIVGKLLFYTGVKYYDAKGG